MRWLALLLFLAGTVASYKKGVKQDKPWGKPLLGLCAGGVLFALIGNPALHYYMILACFGGVLFAYFKGTRQQKEWGTPVVAACTIIIVLLVVGKRVGHKVGGGPHRKEIARARKMNLTYTRAKMLRLGQHLAENVEADTAVLLAPQTPTKYARKRVEVMQDALTEGLGGELKLIDTVSPPPPEGDKGELAGVFPEEVMTAEAFGKMLNEHPEADVIVVTSQIPYNLEETSWWKQPPGKRRPLAVASGGMPPHTMSLMKNGDLLAVVMHNPDFRYEKDKKLPEDPEVAFQERYVLITPKNVAELADRYGIQPTQ